MLVEIWSDVVCPWCYIGKRRFEAALAGFEHRDDVQVVWRAFELDPTATSATADEQLVDGDYAARLGAKYGTDTGQAQAMLDQMTAAAAAEGLEFHFERARSANTVDAHRLLHLAGERGVQDAVEERLLRACFTEGEAVGDRDALVRLVAEAGLDEGEARAALDDDRLLRAVRADEAQAHQLGISGVPFFVLDRRFGVSGAQPAEHLLRALRQAWDEAHPALTLVGAPAAGTTSPEGRVCGPDGCEV